MTTPAIEIDRLVFAWPNAKSTLLRLEKFDAQPREKVFIKGPSGSGKTTLLNLIGGILRPQEGAIRLLGTDICRLNERQRDRFRSDHMGIIFQMFNLIPYLSLVENVTLPCHFSEKRRSRALEKSSDLKQEAIRLLGMLHLDIDELKDRPVSELSVGQQQRVAVARAIIGSPEIVIADEPTSSLDADTRDAFLRLLFEECDLAGATLVFVSHDGSVARLFDRKLDLRSMNETSGTTAATVPGDPLC